MSATFPLPPTIRIPVHHLIRIAVHRLVSASVAASRRFRTRFAGRCLLPSSRDLAAELPLLPALLDPLWGRITRLAVHPIRWPVTPRKVSVAGMWWRSAGCWPSREQHELVSSRTAGGDRSGRARHPPAQRPARGTHRRSPPVAAPGRLFRDRGRP
ncbi:DUF5994 family protein [Streptomyces thermolilacinus]|uniref:DUF5994 family protein n=1 Tax=Streptomyces thermolilacinus TaxID=285540 RepID=UPI0033F0B98D